jgi:haloalkane dehalogenase
LGSEVYRTPEERFAGLPDFPFEPHYVALDGLRMHYLDEGLEDPILLLHGEPTWSFLYVRMIPALRGRFRCIAPDYIGFGRSDKWTDLAAHSFARHFAHLDRVAEDYAEPITLSPGLLKWREYALRTPDLPIG